MPRIRLQIADVIIELSSRWPAEPLTSSADWRFTSFLYTGRQRPDIRVIVNIVPKLPEEHAGRNLFVTTHFQDGKENWRWQQVDSHFVYRTPLAGKEQRAVVNRALNNATLWVLPKEGRRIWNISDVIYDFLQVLLINYLAHRDGMFVHGIGLKDINGAGLLFAGKSGAGKSTTARLWHQHSRATILNDDRIIVRQRGRQFYIYGTPWHGDFSDYLASEIQPASLDKLLFIYHAATHTSKPATATDAFRELYPNTFPPFWDKQALERVVALCHTLVTRVPTYRLGFRKDRSVIPFVRRIR